MLVTFKQSDKKLILKFKIQYLYLKEYLGWVILSSSGRFEDFFGPLLRDKLLNYASDHQELNEVTQQLLLVVTHNTKVILIYMNSQTIVSGVNPVKLFFLCFFSSALS